MPSDSSEIAGQAVRGSLYSVAASGVTISLGFLRSILLARLLLPEHFGVVTLALFYIALAAQLRMLGFDPALIHRKDINETVLGTYFTLRVTTLVLSVALIAGVSPLLSRLYPTMPLLGWILIALAGIEIPKGLSTIQETWLSRNLAFRPLAITDVVASVTMTVVAPLLAWQGWGAWALVGEQASGILARFGMTWLVFRRWGPRPGWDRSIARWFWNYGRAAWRAANLAFLLDRFDDFWIGTSLGKTPLGYYSRAYEFARYPRRVLANPLVSVLGPVFARLQGDRLHLSQAYFRLMSLLVRSGFLVGGLAVLLIPEFVFYVLGAKWLPMVRTFQLMIIYVLLDPLLMATNNLLMAVGMPQAVARVRVAQLIFFVPAVVVAARWAGIEGVALAADGMLMVGFALLHHAARQHVDYSLVRLFGWPTMGAGLGALLALALVGSAGVLHPQPLATAGLKAGAYAGSLGLVLLAAERRELVAMSRAFWASARGRPIST